MLSWKDRFIAYVKSLDENITVDDAEPLIYDELTRIKEVCSEKTSKLDMPSVNADHFNQPDKRMGMPELIALYRELFYGRQDVFAIRWENEKVGTHGYAPKCKNEWDRNICGKAQRIKGACKNCAYRENQEITDSFVQ